MSDLVPLWEPWGGRLLTAAVVLAGLGLVFIGWRRRVRRDGVARCWWCRYELSPGAELRACPECGRVTRPTRLWRRRRAWAWLVAGAALAAAMPAFVAQRRVREHGWGYYVTLRPMYDLWPYRETVVHRDGRARVVEQHDRRWGRGLVSTRPDRPRQRVSLRIAGRETDAIEPGLFDFRMDLDGFVIDGRAFPAVGDADGDGLTDLFVHAWDGGNSRWSVEVRFYEIVGRSFVLRDECVWYPDITATIEHAADGARDLRFTRPAWAED